MSGKMLHSAEEMTALLSSNPRIAMVGASQNPRRAAHGIFKYLRAQGLDVVPVNPSGGELDQVPMLASLSQVEGEVQIVNVFRNPRDLDMSLVEQSVALGAKVLWLQDGVIREDIAEAAMQAGLDVVMNDCIFRRYRMLI